MLIDRLIETAASCALNMDDFDTDYANLEDRYEHARIKLDDVTATIADRRDRLNQAKAIQSYLATRPALEYSHDAWNLLVDQAIVDNDGTINVRFKDFTSAGKPATDA